MLRGINAMGNFKVKVFTGNAKDMETEIAAFLVANKVKIHSFAQSQSTIANSMEVNVTATVLYTEYDSHEEKIGFNR